MAVTNALLSDPDSQPIHPGVQPGSIHVGRRGDLNATGDINILDLIQEIKYVLGALPEPFGFKRFLADPNGDGAINILDIVWMINAVLHSSPAKVLADGPTSPVTVSLGDLQTVASGQLAIPVTMSADGVVAGMQAAFTFDPSQLEPGLPQLAGRAEGMTLQSHVTAGRLQVLIYSPTGQAIPAGHGTTLLVPVTVRSGPEAAPTLTLSQVLLANRGAQAIPVGLGTSTVKVQPLPTAFALKPNRPNPFNPATQIAYDVPQAAHIMLAVYNLLGQEVVRLVETVQPPGRYMVTWDGRNGHGMNVASGVYLYRLTTSAGFSQTRRMTLVK
ncbi:MAG: T9SS type A sorting domain-containing protein [Candidatus Latescibacteria bacterium]|nr:T9SS type A sorting domain-containing protein [Candidatus Latescibacterota bacterium]